MNTYRSRISFNPSLSAAYNIAEDYSLIGCIEELANTIKTHLRQNKSDVMSPILKNTQSLLQSILFDINAIEFINFTQTLKSRLESLIESLRLVILSFTTLLTMFGSNTKINDISIKSLLDISIASKEKFESHIFAL